MAKLDAERQGRERFGSRSVDAAAPDRGLRTEDLRPSRPRAPSFRVHGRVHGALFRADS